METTNPTLHIRVDSPLSTRPIDKTEVVHVHAVYPSPSLASSCHGGLEIARPSHHIAPLRPNALGRRGILRSRWRWTKTSSISSLDARARRWDRSLRLPWPCGRGRGGVTAPLICRDCDL
eukprot:scaffold5212_cov108-Isochrysis_galbana.AAC.5